MISLSDECVEEQESIVTPVHYIEFYIYKQWPGKIKTYGASLLEMWGDAADFFNEGDVFITNAGPNGLDHEYTIVGNPTYSDVVGRTQIPNIDGALVNFEQNLPGKDYVYKKYDLSEYVIDKSIGDIRKHFEDRAFGKLRPHQLNISLMDDEDEVSLSGTKMNPEIFFKDMYQSEVISTELIGNQTKIILEEHTYALYDIDIFKPYSIRVIDGKARNKIAKITKLSGFSKCIYVWGDYTDIEAGDTIAVLMQNKFYCKLKFGIKNFPDDTNNVFFGIIYPKNITKANRRIDLICYSLVKDWDEEFAFQVSANAKNLPGVPGVDVYSYGIGSKRVEEERLVKVQYRFPAGNLQSVTGVAITKASADTGTGPRLLRFRSPNQFQWSEGTWTEVASHTTSTVDDQILTASDGSTITADFRFDDYAEIDAEEIIFMAAKSKMDVKVLERGPAGLRVDGGGEFQLFSKLMRIWVDKSYVAGTVNDDIDINDVVIDEPMEIFPVTGNHIAVYFGSIQKVGALEFKGINPIGENLTNGIWEYSLSFGTDPSCFDTLTVEDGTENMSHDGVVKYTIPDDYGKKAKIGSSSDFHMYWIRWRRVAGITNAITVDEVLPYTTCFGSQNDIFIFRPDYHRFTSDDDLETDITIRYDDNVELDLYVWKQCVRAVDIYNELIEKSGYGINTNLADGEIVLAKSGLNIWGKPYFIEERKPSAMCIGFGQRDGAIFACFKNIIMMLPSNTSEWVKLGEVVWNVTLTAISYDERIESGDTRYYIIVHGFKDTTPQGSMDQTNYYEQPNQIIVRIDGLNSDDPGDWEFRFKTVTNGGNTYGSNGYSSGSGLIDSFHLWRSGTHDYYGGTGYVAHIGYSTFSPGLEVYTDNIIIPCSQLIMRLNNYYGTTAFGKNDIDVDQNSLFQDMAAGFNYDIQTPANIQPDYLQCDIFTDPDVLKHDEAFRQTLGQHGGFIGVKFHDYGGVVEHGIWGLIHFGAANWYTNPRWNVIEDISYNTALLRASDSCGYGALGEISWGDGSAQASRFIGRVNLLCACQLPENNPGSSEDDYVLQGTYNDWYQLQNNRYVGCEKLLEITTLRKSDTCFFQRDDTEMWLWDNSAGTWLDVTSAESPKCTLNQDDILLIADTRKFARLYMKTNVAGDVDLSYSTDFSTIDFSGPTDTWEALDICEDDFSGAAAGLTNGLLDFPMAPKWLKVDYAPGGAPSPVIVNKYIIRIQQTGTGTLSVYKCKFTKCEVWSSKDDYYYGAGPTYSKYYDFVPLDICHNTYSDRVIGCMLDQTTMEYFLFAIDNIAFSFNAKSLEDTTDRLKIVQIDDPEMALKSFVADPINGYVYFVACDLKYKRKTAELWRVKWDSVAGDLSTPEKMTELIAGEWDSPTKLVCINSRIYGFTAPNRGYFWEWADELYIRLPVADLGKSKCRDAMNNVGQIINLIAYTDENAKTITRKRLSDLPVVDKEWGESQLKNIEFVRESPSQIEGVMVNWNDKDVEMDGIEKVGETGLGNNYLSVSNPLIYFPQVARIVAEQLWKFFVKRRREIEGSIIFLYQHQLFDVVKTLLDIISNTSHYGVSSNDLWQIKSLIVSWKNKRIRFLLLENRKEETGVS